MRQWTLQSLPEESNKHFINSCCNQTCRRLFPVQRLRGKKPDRMLEDELLSAFLPLDASLALFSLSLQRQSACVALIHIFWSLIFSSFLFFHPHVFYSHLSTSVYLMFPLLPSPATSPLPLIFFLSPILPVLLPLNLPIHVFFSSSVYPCPTCVFLCITWTSIFLSLLLAGFG